MANRLIFLYFCLFVISWGRTKPDNPSRLMISCLNGKVELIGKSVSLL